MVVARVILLDVVVHLRTRLAEWVFAAILALFACRLLAPGETFAHGNSYTYMASWMSETSWGYLIGIIALLRLSALTINGSLKAFRPWSPGVRSLTAWMSAGVWGCLALGFYLSNPDGTGPGTYGVICAADISLAIVIAHDAGHAIRTRRNGAG